MCLCVYVYLYIYIYICIYTYIHAYTSTHTYTPLVDGELVRHLGHAPRGCQASLSTKSKPAEFKHLSKRRKKN